MLIFYYYVNFSSLIALRNYNTSISMWQWQRSMYINKVRASLKRLV